VAPSSKDPVIQGGVADSPDRMVGDINFFLYPWDGEDGENDAASAGGVSAPSHDGHGAATSTCYVGEVDIMIAESAERGRGFGRAAVTALVHYISCNLSSILQEHHRGEAKQEANITETAPGSKMDLHLHLRQLMVKIKQANAASIALFNSLGFVQDGHVNYFGEVKLVLNDYAALASQAPEGYRELVYHG